MEKSCLFFIRHGKLSSPYDDHAKMPFRVLADLASTKLNPSIDSNYIKKSIKNIEINIPLDKIEVIYASPSKRCQETAKLIKNCIAKNNKNIPIIASLELKEVEFNLNKIYKDKKEFRFNNLNKKVLESMATGTGTESLEKMQKRINKFIDKTKNDNNKALAITHDFIMRVIEVCATRTPDKKRPVTLADLKKTQRNNYLNGFSVDKNFRKIKSIVF